jgi:hypothetical protein
MTTGLLFYAPSGEPCSALAWSRHLAREREIARDQIDGRLVSTIYIGLDRSCGMAPRPLIFETLVRGTSDLSDELFRFTTRERALAAHIVIVESLKAGRGVPGYLADP